MRTSVTNMRGVRAVTLIETVVCEGDGTKDDPVRLVTYYWTLDGQHVATSDDSIREPSGIGNDGLFPHERNR